MQFGNSISKGELCPVVGTVAMDCIQVKSKTEVATGEVIHSITQSDINIKPLLIVVCSRHILC